jgi:hypothetical protein
MRTSQFAVLLAVVTVGSTATAHSWRVASVIGTINPGTLRCEGQHCTVTISAERVRHRSPRDFNPGQTIRSRVRRVATAFAAVVR